MMNSKAIENPKAVALNRCSNMDMVDEDIVENILSRLPAFAFASAACVSRSWNLRCDSVLSSPKLSSALSQNPSSLQDAFDEVFDKVFAQPIRPHFAIVSVGPSFNAREARRLIIKKLGATVPIICHSPYGGLIGADAITDEFKEIQWDFTEDHEPDFPFLGEAPVFECEKHNRAVQLTVGFLPGLKVSVVPLFHSKKEVLYVDEFVTNIRECTFSVSRSTSPAAIMLFTDIKTDMDPVLQYLDYAMSPETVIVGDGRCVLSCEDDCLMKNSSRKNRRHGTAAVALVFMRDKDKSPEFFGQMASQALSVVQRQIASRIGNIQFHAALSSGMSPIGPTFKAISVKGKFDERQTWLTAKRDGFVENLDGQTILSHVYDELGDHVRLPALYIGVVKRRKFSVGMDKMGSLTSRVFHEIYEGCEEYLYVGGGGIKTGDIFRFFTLDSQVASSSLSNVSDKFNHLKLDRYAGSSHDINPMKKVFGGIIFSCCGRGEPFFGKPNADSSPFLENFPGVTFAGSFCAKEISRGDSTPYCQEAQQEGSYRCGIHFHSSVYLIMSYTPSLSK